MKIVNRHVFISGAAKRIARRIAERLIEEGAALTIHYRNSKEEAEELVALARKKGLKAVSVQADLKDMRSLEKAVAASQKELGPIDILINSASDFFSTPTMDCTEDQWDSLIDVNLKGQFFLSRECARSILSANRPGVIINIADIYASKPRVGYTPYVISKAGLIMMTRNLAKEWAPLIRVNSVSPGPVLLPEWYSEEQEKKAAAKTLLGRWGTPEDIVNGTLFLIQNDYITGFDLRVDGGRSLN
jgi:pteridine reductase